MTIILIILALVYCYMVIIGDLPALIDYWLCGFFGYTIGLIIGALIALQHR